MRARAALLLAAAAAAAALLAAPTAAAAESVRLPNPTHAGLLPVSNQLGSSIYYMYFEAAEADDVDLATAPIILWLQGGPGCSSLFGTFYLNGPYALQANLTLLDNPGKWNRRYGMLFIDQPIGTGFSLAGNQPIPHGELPLAADVYAALQGFYTRHSAYKRRPLYITGESYAGKYVPSISHYIVQAAAMADGSDGSLRKRRALPADVAPPVFKLGGLAIGNGFTDAVVQTKVQAEVAFNLGLLDSRQRAEAEAIQEEVVQLVLNRDWRKARMRSDALLAYITNASATATLEDIRRDKPYDAEDRVSRYLNLPEVRANIAAPPVTYSACSKAVDAVMGHDVMKSVAHLVPDLLARSHVLLYQGQFDAECGVASNEAWISRLAWPGHLGFMSAERRFWRDDAFGSQVLGFVKSHKRLTHLVVRNAGHMVPHDRPEVSQRMIETWVESAQQGLDTFEPAAAARSSSQQPEAAVAVAVS